MKRVAIMIGSILMVLGFVLVSQAKPHIYKWVKDKRVSSEEVLQKSEYTRVLAISEQTALEWVKKVMGDDLYMSQAEYHKTRHQQDAETNPDTVLPEEIIRQAKMELADEDYRFLLEVTLKKYGGDRTRVIVTASPVYRIRDSDAESARDEDAGGETTVDVKIKGDRNSMVGIGPIFVMPIPGLPSDYNIAPLPDAAERAGKLVRSFLYFMDKRIAGNKAKVSAVAQPEAESNSGSEGNLNNGAESENANNGVEVDIKVKHKK